MSFLCAVVCFVCVCMCVYLSVCALSVTWPPAFTMPTKPRSAKKSPRPGPGDYYFPSFFESAYVDVHVDLHVRV